MNPISSFYFKSNLLDLIMECSRVSILMTQAEHVQDLHITEHSLTKETLLARCFMPKQKSFVNVHHVKTAVYGYTIPTTPDI